MESTDEGREISHEFHPSKIMVCFDGSNHSRKALSTGISLASKYQSHLIVVYALPLPLNGFGLGEPYYEWDQFEKATKTRIEGQLEPFKKKSHFSRNFNGYQISGRNCIGAGVTVGRIC